MALIIELFLIGVGLSMDAFAVSICKGLGMEKINKKQAFTIGLYFGGFQALMRLLGFLLASSFAEYIIQYEHWIAFALLFLIGASMLREAFSKEKNEADASFSVKTMLLLAVATSIDALATGVSFAVTDTNIWLAVSIIGVTTFLFSAAGVKVGSIFGRKYQSKAEFLGGLILILIGVKILIEHLSGAA